jgi:type II secretory pathway component PulF
LISTRRAYEISLRLSRFPSFADNILQSHHAYWRALHLANTRIVSYVHVVTLRKRIRFFQQLAVLMRAALPIRSSIERLHERLGGHELAVLAQQLSHGERLADAFTSAGFQRFETNLVAAGERSGQLETVLDHIAQFWQHELEFRRALVTPLVYPIVVLHFAIILSSGIDLLNGGVSAAIAGFIIRLAVLYASLILIYVLTRATWSSPLMKSFWLRLPIVGRALRSAFAYRWITTLRLEFGAGVSLYRAVGDAWRASGFVDCERIGTESEEAIRSGASFTRLAQSWRQLPRDWVDFIETGEVSGKFDDAFRALEAEASQNFKFAQQRMANWLPKIVYFFALLVVAWQVVQVAEKVYIDPIEQAEKLINNPGN